MERVTVPTAPRTGPISRATSVPSCASLSSGMKGVQLLSPTVHHGLRATTIMSNHHKKAAVFDFDSFTLEAVRKRHESESMASFSHSISQSIGSSSPRSPSMVRRHSKSTNSFDGQETHSVRSMDDYEWGQRNTHVSTTSSSRMYQHMSSMSSVGTINKRMSMASSTTSSALRNANGSIPRLRAEVVVRGWLQRRRGRVLKRWKAQYCVLKTDQQLCLYANEDTVNGRLEGRFQLLRVTYNDRHGSFQVIGIGSDETPYKEEFRPLDDDGWRMWFLALREYLTPASIHDALDRMPELSLLPGVHASLLEDDDEDDGGDFTHEVEEMAFRPYAGSTFDERPSVSNTDTMSTSSSTHNQRVHSFSNASDRKTVLFDPEDLTRSTTTHNNQRDADIPTELPRAANYRKLYTGGVRRKTTSLKDENGRNPHALAHGVLAGTVDMRPSTQFGDNPIDCPMIERDSQNTVAMLERCGSESIVSSTSRGSDSGYSWNRP